jgi:hypothetical protein
VAVKAVKTDGMDSRVLLVSAIAAVAVVSGCGSSSSGASSPGSSATTTTSPGALSSTIHDALAQRIALAAPLPGEQSGATATYQTRAEFAEQDTNPADAAQFEAEGLQAVASEHLKVPGTNDAVRSVFSFGTAKGAADDLQQVLKSSPRSTVSRFAVPAIPGAVGTEPQTANGAVAGRNVLFVVGTYEYVVGVAPTSGGSTAAAPSRHALAAAATAWYSKVKDLG